LKILMSCPDALKAVPAGFDGLIWTDAIGKVGPSWKKKARAQVGAEAPARNP
jgi:hypothetical protein